MHLTPPTHSTSCTLSVYLPLSFSLSHWIQFVLLKYSWVWGLLWIMDLPGVTPLMKISASPSNYQLAIAPKLETGNFSLAWAYLLRSFPCSHDHCEWPAISRKQFSFHPLSLALTVFHPPLSQWSLSLGGLGCSIWGWVLYSFLFPIFWQVVSLYVVNYYKKQLLWWGLTSALINRNSDKSLEVITYYILLEE